MIAALRRNFGYKLLSVVIAVLLYYVASAQQNPRIARELLVQPEVVNVPPGLVVSEPPRPIPITVTGLAVTVNALRSQSIKASTDASSGRAGVNSLPVTLTLPPNVRAEPGPSAESAEVRLEREGDHPYGVDVDFTGTAPVGYTYGDPVPDPTSVRVVGPEDTVARVRRVAARVQKGTDEGAIDRVVTLIPEDAQQRVVEGVEIRPAQARVRIGLKRLPATKYMLLSARIEGEPAPGYAVRTYEFEPRTVLVIGPPDLLSSRSSIDVPVDVTGVSGRGIVARPVTVTPPDGLRLQGDATVRVRLDVRPVDPAVGATPAAPTPTPAPRESRGAVATPAPAATPTPAAPARAAGTE